MSLDSDFRQVLANMETWLSYGTTMNLQPTRGGEKEGTGRPPGEEHPPHVEYRRRWDSLGVLDDPARSERREELLETARRELKALQKQKKVVVVEETQAELEKRIVQKLREKWTVEDVATSFKVNPKFVRKAWATALLASKKVDEPVDQREEIKRLAAKDLTERQVAMHVGVSTSTVRRVLGRAA